MIQCLTKLMSHATITAIVIIYKSDHKTNGVIMVAKYPTLVVHEICEII